MHSQIIEANPEFLPAVLKAVSLAMVECHTASSLEPLAPYWRLKELGSDAVFQEVLSNWIRRGELEDGAPVPTAARAGSKAESFDSRKTVVLKYFQTMRDLLVKGFQTNETEANIFHVPRIYEIREYVTHALDDIIEFINSLEDTEGIAY
jgi:hypothetical protein